MILLPLLIQAQTPVSPPQNLSRPAVENVVTLPTETGSTITVTGDNLKAAQADLDSCLRDHCPPKEDIKRSLTYAELQFIAGDYRGSHGTLAASRYRNARYAAELPHEVSGLHRALGRLTRLNGLPSSPITNASDAVYALRAGLPAGTPAIYQQRLEVGDAMAREGRAYGALQHYGWVAHSAEKAGLSDVLGQALVRTALVTSALAADHAEWRPRAKASIDQVLNRPEPGMRPYRNVVRTIAIQLASDSDRPAVIDKVLAEMEPDGDQQVAVYSPSILPRDLSEGATAVDAGPAFVDISFRVMPDGHVKDIEPVNLTTSTRPAWIDVVTKALAERRYTRLPHPTNSDGMLRLERYTFISRLGDDTGSRMMVRSTARQISRLDLTAAVTPVGARQ
jgi:hypothetical protein